MVAVSEEVYRAWWQETEHACYLERQAQAREISWQSREDISDEDTLSLFCSRSPPAPDDPGADALKQALLAALAEEPPDLVEVLWQLACDSITFDEIAADWHVSRQAVIKRVQRAHKRLRNKLTKN